MIYDIIILNYRYIEAKMTDERKEFGKKLIEIRERKGLRQGWPSRDYTVWIISKWSIYGNYIKQYK